MLSGLKIKEEIANGNIFISDFDEKRLNPNSYNVRLSDRLCWYADDVLDMKSKNPMLETRIPDEGFILQPNTFYLGQTMEKTSTEKYVCGYDGRSSVGRLGIGTHITAGFGDVGFNGYWTLEIFVFKPVIIYPFVEIGQVFFDTLDGDFKLYNSNKYQGNNGIQGSMMYKDFQK